MSSASAAAESDAGGASPKKGKKKLIVIAAAVLVLALAGGGGAVFVMKKNAAAAAAAAEEDGEESADAAPAKHEEKKRDSKHPPTFVPLDPFVVNLADKDAERYAQIGITLEVDDAHFAEEVKAYMPAIRNGILMTLSHKTSQELLSLEGKVALSKEIMREAVRPLGIEPAASEAKGDADEEDEDGHAKKKKKKKAAPGRPNPITHVHYSNFIVQ